MQLPRDITMATIFTIAKRSFQSFGSDKCSALAAAIAYYTIFSLFPLALLGVSLLGFFVGDEAARRQVVDGIVRVISLGDEGREALAGTMEGVNHAKGWLGFLGLFTAAWSASGLFGQLRSAMDSVWDVDRPLPFLRARFHDLLLLFGFGGLLIASTASTGVVQAAQATGAD
jgi:membrane protein